MKDSQATLHGATSRHVNAGRLFFLRADSSLDPFSTPTDVAYRICEDCGLVRSEIDQLIDDMQHGTLSREASLELFRRTLERREDAELCVDCAEAVLDAAAQVDTP